MREVSERFKQAIRKQNRKCEVKLEFATEQTPLILHGKDLKELKYIAQIESELGGVEVQLLSIKLMKGVADDLYNTNTKVKCWIGVEDEQVTEWCCLGEFITDTWGKREGSGVISVECIDALSALCEKDMPFVPTMLNTTKLNYLSTIVTNISVEATTTSGIHDGKLIMAMLSGTQVGDTLKPLTFAMNAFARYRDRLEFNPFKVKEAADVSLTYSDMLFHTEGGKDGTMTFDKVNICTYVPGSDEYKEIYKLDSLVPANHTNFKIGTINFSDPMLTKCINFSHEINIRDFNIGTDKVAIFIDNQNQNTIPLEVALHGSELNEATIDTNENTENKIKTIKNIYIQDATSINTLDSRIYVGEEVKAKYRGNPAIEIGDTVGVEDIGNILVTYQELSYTGALSGNLKGVLISD